MTKYYTTDFDVVYISYDEPNAEKNWADLKAKLPNAKRVHGVKGFDAAHREAGKLSETDRLITVDGDNIVREDFFLQEVEIDDIAQANHIFSWRGLNIINNLSYGNGGLKLWPKHVIMNLSAHEESEDGQGVDFCWMNTYVQLVTTWSEVHVNENPEQAYRAGFREGIKLSLNMGDKVDKWKFYEENARKNLERLSIWCSVGRDVLNGCWAMLGARTGAHFINNLNFEHSQIADYEWFKEHWEETYSIYKDKSMFDARMNTLGQELRQNTQLRVAELDDEGSAWFKSVYDNEDFERFYPIMITEAEAAKFALKDRMQQKTFEGRVW